MYGESQVKSIGQKTKNEEKLIVGDLLIDWAMYLHRFTCFLWFVFNVYANKIVLTHWTLKC